MKHKVKLLILALLVAALLVSAFGCYPLRITPKPRVDAMNTDMPEDTSMPTQGADDSNTPTIDPDNSVSPISGTDLPTENPAEPTNAATTDIAPTDVAGNTPAPTPALVETPAVGTPAPSPVATNTPRPTPTPVVTEPPEPTPTQNSSDFADFSSGTINGYGTYTNAMFGKAPLTMINFWATWCGPCIEELPHIQQLAGAFAGRVQIVTVLYDSSTEGASDTALAIMQGIGFNLPVIRCNSSVRKAFVNPYGISALPATFFIDSEGNLVKLVSGSHDYNQWVSLINGLL